MHTPPPDTQDGSEIQHAINASPALPLPAAPRPSADPGIKARITPSAYSDDNIPPEGDIDIFKLSPVAALGLLCSSIEDLVLVTGDVPLTPPTSNPSTPYKEDNSSECHDAMGIPITKTPIGSPEAHPAEPFHIIGCDEPQPLYVQHGALARKFYSKAVPAIPLKDYLFRLHKYCPMSTAVYLATSLYIHRLAIVERLIPLTPRNVHRLVLAGLRIAMKALEDLSYNHQRFAKVGGVSEPELGRLEISFCFLTEFDLKVDAEALKEHALAMRDGAKFNALPPTLAPVLPSRGGMSRTLVSAQIDVATAAG
jgi:hypothetical protein